MVGSHNQPYLYEAERNSRFLPETTFDPKAVTRASWEPKPVKPKQEGPLIQINRHPDSYEIIGANRRDHPGLGEKTKWWIKATRIIQLILRVLELIGAIAILVLMILIDHVSEVTAWIMRVVAGIVIFHCLYGIIYTAKPITSKSPASSVAYQIFAAFSDLAVLPLYVYGCYCAVKSSGSWSTRLSNTDLYPYLKAAFYYILIVAGSLHVVSMAISFWLALKFRQILNMPPDMNPMEDRYATRMKKEMHSHTRNQSSVVTMGTLQSFETAHEKPVVRAPTVPFMHTRTASDVSSARSRDSRSDLPSRHYQISVNGGDSPRTSMSHLKRASIAGTPTSYGRGSFADVPLHDGNSPNSDRYSARMSMASHSRPTSRHAASSSRPSSRHTNASVAVSARANTRDAPPLPASPSKDSSKTDENTQMNRSAKFTEAWYTSDSLINRTQQRNNAVNTMILGATGKRSNYAAIGQGYEDPEWDDENGNHPTDNRPDHNQYESLAAYNDNVTILGGNDDEELPGYSAKGVRSDEESQYDNYNNFSKSRVSINQHHNSVNHHQYTAYKSPKLAAADTMNSLNNVTVYEEDDLDYHPNPLRSNPMPQRPKTPYRRPDTADSLQQRPSTAERPKSAAPTLSSLTSAVSSSTEGGSILGELHLNSRRVSGGLHAPGGHGDLGDKSSRYELSGRTLTTPLSPPNLKKPATTAQTPSVHERASEFEVRAAAAAAEAGSSSPAAPSPAPSPSKQLRQTSKRWTWAPRARDSSIQADEKFYSKPYGELRSGTPPVVVGQNRQVSSGNDYDLGSATVAETNTEDGSDRYLFFGGRNGSNTFSRRNVSGRAAEEGRAYSRYSVLNE